MKTHIIAGGLFVASVALLFLALELFGSANRACYDVGEIFCSDEYTWNQERIRETTLGGAYLITSALSFSASVVIFMLENNHQKLCWTINRGLAYQAKVIAQKKGE